MKILTKEEFELEKETLFRKIADSIVFIHPTDTIYGIGCSALSSEGVKKIRELKGRHDRPFSVMAPSKEWIRENCEVSSEAEEWVGKLPGPYTLILKLKNRDCIAPEVNMGLDTLGVRIPEHWFSDVVGEIGIPIITTSANLTGESFMTSLEDLDDRIKSKVDFIIYEDKKHGKPSMIVDLSDGVKVRER